MRNWLPAVCIFGLSISLVGGVAAAEPPDYRAIQAMPTGKTVTLTGHDLNLEQIVRIARLGDKVEVSPEAVRHQEDAYRLLLEAAAEGVPIAGFNRENGKPVFEGDPSRPENAALIQQRVLARFKNAAADPNAPESTDEAPVRAVMVVCANTLTYAAASPPILQLLVGFLNNRITPVSVKGGAMRAIAAAMIGEGDVYFAGKRVKAAAALAMSGLTKLEPMAIDDHALMDGGEAGIAEAALMTADARRALDWGDLVIALDLTAANANIAPLSTAAQANRPFRWMNWNALRLLEMLKGGALFESDPDRKDELPDRLRATLEAQAAAWMAWGALREVLVIAVNSSDQSPAVRVGLSTRESFELGTPQMMKFAVKGGRANGGKRGYIVGTVNDDPTTLNRAIGVFGDALLALSPLLAGAGRPGDGPGQIPMASADTRGAQTSASVALAEAAVASMPRLLSVEFVRVAADIDQRLRDHPDLKLGAAPVALMTAWHERVAARSQQDDDAFKFIQANSITSFFPGGDAPPGNDDFIPLAQERVRQ